MSQEAPRVIFRLTFYSSVIYFHLWIFPLILDNRSGFPLQLKVLSFDTLTGVALLSPFFSHSSLFHIFAALCFHTLRDSKVGVRGAWARQFPDRRPAAGRPDAYAFVPYAFYLALFFRFTTPHKSRTAPNKTASGNSPSSAPASTSPSAAPSPGPRPHESPYTARPSTVESKRCSLPTIQR